MIVKIQKPLMTNGDEPLAYIYNQSRSVELHIPLSTVESLFEEGEFKIFAKARLIGTTLKILGKAKWQDW